VIPLPPNGGFFLLCSSFFIMNTLDDVIASMEARGANHDIPLEDMVAKLPPSVDTLPELTEWLDTKDISHIKPVSTHPHLVNDPDNWVWEDSDVNRARGAEIMSDAELIAAQIDNLEDAERLQVLYDPTIDFNPAPFFMI